MSKHYNNLEFGKLSEYITPDKFRTITKNMRACPMGISEFAVEIHIKDKIKKMLSFYVPFDGVIYGCARDKNVIKEKLNLESNIKIAYIEDWDDKFLLLLELENAKEKPVMFVNSSDIVYLLENSIRVTEQRK